MRKVIHVDMDAFYASVEQRDRPELRGRPVAVGGDPDGRGVVAAASYEARRFGIRSAMPCARARRLCPDLVFVRPDFSKYSAVSKQIHAVFHEVTELVEPLALDEAYLDVTENRLEEPLAGKLAKHLKARIREETQLVASAGVGPNKLVAKLASALQKPDGLVIIPPERVDAFLLPLPVRKLWGVGPKTAERLEGMGIRTVSDVRDLTPEHLEHILGSFGPFLYELAHGRDDRKVSPHRARKSRGAERTLDRDLSDLQDVLRLVDHLAHGVGEDLARIEQPGRTVVLKIRYSDFTTVTRSRTLASPTTDAARIASAARELVADTEAGRRPVRLVGVTMSNLVEEGAPLQLELELPG
ncbi:MAG: DNA polymerase IV [Myxococcales bacterium]|nr:DNA polymerase IV [Myxococcales bacterium]